MKLCAVEDLTHRNLHSARYVIVMVNLVLIVGFTARTPNKHSREIYLSITPTLRRLLLKRSYLVLDERAETHKHKFVISTLIDELGEVTALQELEKTGVVHSGYRVHSINSNSITLVKNHDDARLTLLEPRKIVRIIGKEGKGIPFLACVNEKGFVREVDDAKLVVDLDGNTISERAKTQLSSLPIIIIPDEINLTRRVLEPMDRFHKLAADIMLPPGFYPGNQNEPRF